MRLCGKRLFTPACKWVRSMLEGCGSAFAGPHFFLDVWERAFFQGVLANSGCFGVVFLW